MKKVCLIAVLCLLCEVVSAQGYIVEVRNGVAPGNVAGRHGVNATRTFSSVNGFAGQLNAGQLRGLQRNRNVISVVPDRRVNAIARGGNKKPKSPAGQVASAGAQRIGAVDLPFTGLDVGVAIADTGLDSSHQDLNVSPTGFTAHGGSHQDDNGHGTHCGGIVAAKNNSIDTVGVAPDVVLYSVKVLNAQGSGFDSDIMAGFDWIVQNANLVNPPIRAVNVSLGRPGTVNDNPLMHQLVQVLHGMNITVCVAAGNDCNSVVSQQIPAAYQEVIAVASTTAQAGSNKCRQFSGFIDADTASYFTTDGGVDISAPGENREDINRGCFIRPVGILSTALGGGTTRMLGTSQATPHITGVVAILQDKAGGTLDVETVRTIIKNSAGGIGSVPLDSPVSCYTFDGTREGVVDAPEALDAVQ